MRHKMYKNEELEFLHFKNQNQNTAELRLFLDAQVRPLEGSADPSVRSRQNRHSFDSDLGLLHNKIIKIIIIAIIIITMLLLNKLSRTFMGGFSGKEKGTMRLMCSVLSINISARHHSAQILIQIWIQKLNSYFMKPFVLSASVFR